MGEVYYCFKLVLGSSLIICHVNALSPIYPQKFVQFAIALLLGAKNGQAVGMKSNTVRKDVAVVEIHNVKLAVKHS
jgi:hypothetical protein